MDQSLARGVRNQLFRQIGARLDRAMEKWLAFTKQSRIDQSRGAWERFCNRQASVLESLLVTKYVGGTPRKPFVCLYLLENHTNWLTSWDEQCFSTSQMCITRNPVLVDTEPLGFTISEHAVMRIFERSFTDTDPTLPGFEPLSFTRELRYAPLWSTYWAHRSSQYLDRGGIHGHEAIIPGVNGVLLGRIKPKSLNRVEIRTFLADRQLNGSELKLVRAMREASTPFLGGAIPFLVLGLMLERFSAVLEMERFRMAIQDIEPMMKIEDDTVDRD